jgi:hypothetical protein
LNCGAERGMEKINWIARVRNEEEKYYMEARRREISYI